MTLPVAWIVDIDGTLALCGNRNPYDWESAGTDVPNWPVLMVVQALACYPVVSSIIVVSGREEKARFLTERWLHEWAVPHDELHMRLDGDNRADDMVKEEMFRTKIERRYAVAGVIDDRDRVVKMWRRIGLVCLQVAEGNF